jgi:hypothetical protein
MLSSSKWFISVRFFIQNFVCKIHRSYSVMYLIHLIFLDLLTLTILSEQYKLSCSFL